jgi:alcohol dehydrogenase class IV
MRPFDYSPRTRIVFGAGSLARLGELAMELGFSRTLIVADPGIVAAGYASRAAAILRERGISSVLFDQFAADPDVAMVEAGRVHAAAHAVDSLVALGGGSSLDCAKGINVVLTNGGTMRDYRGFGKVLKPMLPAIGVPTTAGTGSEAQSYSIISDPLTHAKMACGDPKAAFAVALLDPELTTSLPPMLTAITGYDAISHAVESYVAVRRTPLSDLFAREAWRLLDGHFEPVLDQPGEVAARGAMLVGAHYAGAAVEHSMLGATHACANPLSARYGTTHGAAIAVLLPHVVRWNAREAGHRYDELLRASGHVPTNHPGEQLGTRLEQLARTGGLRSRLRDLGVARRDLAALASDAATQWTGTFNPRPFDVDAALALYERAY